MIRNMQTSSRHRQWKFIPPPLNLASIEEERGSSEYDCGYFDLGTESPASASTSNFMESSALVENWARDRLTVPSMLSRRPSARRSLSPMAYNPRNLTKHAVDRDCGICFEYAVVPCRTLCCGQVFCTEHLADWLHGPKAEGRCPNCENACSLEGGTLSLVSPKHAKRPQTMPGHLLPSLPPVQHHSTDALTTSQDQLHSQTAATLTKNSSTSASGSSTEAPSTCSSTIDYSETTVCAEESREGRHIHHTFSKEGFSTGSFSPPWGVVSRLISLVVFLMFLYKLQS